MHPRMPWLPHPSVPLAHPPPAAHAPSLRIFLGKPHALAFLADGALVIGTSHGLRVHDPASPLPARSELTIGGRVHWMLAHPDGTSVVAAVHGPQGASVVRAWPASGERITLLPVAELGYSFCAGLSPDGARFAWRELGVPPVLHVVDAGTGAPLLRRELPQDCNGAGSLAVHVDGSVYITTSHLLIVHPDGRHEPRDQPWLSRIAAPLFIEPGGAMICENGDRVAFDGAENYRRSLPDSAHDGSVSYDRERLGFHKPNGPVQVWDVATRRVIFKADLPRATGQLASWPGQATAASATHVAAIDHGEASVLIWELERPAAPPFKLTGYSLGARRLARHGDLLTVHTCQPPNTLPSVLEIDITTGAARLLDTPEVHDVVRTADGERMLVMHDTGPMQPIAVDTIDPAGAVTGSLAVQRGAGELALSPDDELWGVVSHTYTRGDPTVHAQWRAFAATRWAKTVKLKGFWQHIALCDTAAAVVAGEDLEVLPFTRGAPLRTRKVPTGTHALAISPGGAYVALVGHDGPLLVEVATGATIVPAIDLPGRPPVPHAVCFESETHMFIGHDSGAITRHAVPSGAQEAALLGHTDKVRALLWADGALWSGSEDGTIVRWSAPG